VYEPSEDFALFFAFLMMSSMIAWGVTAI
jgi:hypothetical protein